MIKKLKSIEQIKSEFRKFIYVQGTNDDSIFFYNKYSLPDGSISYTMKNLFGKEIDVIPAETYKNYYQWESETNFNRWYFKDEWFEDDVGLLPEELFEI